MLLAAAAFILWIVILLLPWRPWWVSEQWDPPESLVGESLAEVTVLIPARNEQQVIGKNLSAIIDQGPHHSIMVIDDQSTDSTFEIAAQFNPRIEVLSSKPLPAGWTGKLWALEQGRNRVNTPLVLLLDADIELQPGVIAGLVKFMEEQSKDMVSLMALPPLNSWWERLLMPAFVYYFKMLYPFSLANSSFKYVAAAAGGCILIRAQVLEQIGGFKNIGTSLIDDCQLAKEVKMAGFSTWLGLTHSAKSIRPYGGLSEIWNMVARTAYTQLNKSVGWLLLCTAIICLAYLVPLAALGLGQNAIWMGAATLSIMYLTYLPVLFYYRLSWLWAITMPVVACLFLAMTWTSALRYWQGERMRWRGRTTFAQ